MKGKILDYNIQESTGIISGDDGQRYSFSNEQWKASESPKVNQTVDFEVDGQSAKAIYVLKSQVSDFASSLNIEGSEARKGAVYGAIGSGLVLLSVIPVLGILLLIGGIVLELLGAKKLSDNAQTHKDIFINMLYGYILVLIGTIIMSFIMGASILGGAMSMGNGSDFGAGVGIGGMIFGFIVYIIFAIASIVKMYKSLNSIGLEYNNSFMQLTAKVYVAGILLVPIFGLGFIILLIFSIMKIFAYLKIEKQ